MKWQISCKGELILQVFLTIMLTQFPSHFFPIYLPRYQVLATNSFTSTDRRRLTPRDTIRVGSVSNIHVCSSQIALGQHIQYISYCSFVLSVLKKICYYVELCIPHEASSLSYTGLTWIFCIYKWESLHINFYNTGNLVSGNRTRNHQFSVYFPFTLYHLLNKSIMFGFKKKH